MENTLEWEQGTCKGYRSSLGVPLSRPHRLITLRSSCRTNRMPACVFLMPSCKSRMCVVYNKGENMEHGKVIFEMSAEDYK